MFRILEARFLSADVKLFRIRAPKIAEKRKAGQFAILRVTKEGERIPLTIADSDAAEGSITLIVQGVGKTTKMLNSLETGDFLADLAGPLGTPSHIENFGTAVSIGGGVGTAIAFPTAKALKEAGNHTIAIIGGRTKELVILEDELKEICDEVYPTTDDGSYGFHGFVTQKLQELIDEGRKIDFVLAIGPIPMMQAVAEVTRPHRIHTVVSLNPIMVDGTGMCGGCRVMVGNETKFACVDGPEFDGHEVDFDLLTRRNKSYLGFERDRREELDHLDRCRLEEKIAELRREGEREEKAREGEGR
ncbi:MAG: sulfide/dihydroorotate dehydrogenase-like FAD/NAD-binding protein [Candidatus Eisenbacteria bacterium]|nr:sulfide/dihydroorotate dehydrogenase-like FAD/NAD-binding protein [Candidatus Eisenbacteria bacterium]